MRNSVRPADPTNTLLSVATVFKGTAARAPDAYAFGTMGTIAGIARSSPSAH